MTQRGSREYGALSRRHSRARDRDRDDDYRPTRREDNAERLKRFLHDLDDDVSSLGEWSIDVDESLEKHKHALTELARVVKRLAKNENIDVDMGSNMATEGGSRSGRGRSRFRDDDDFGEQENKTIKRRRRNALSSSSKQEAIDNAILEEEEVPKEQPQSNASYMEATMASNFVIEVVKTNWIGHAGSDWLSTIPTDKDVSMFQAKKEFVSNDYLNVSALAEIEQLMDNVEADSAPLTSSTSNLVINTISEVDFVSIDKATIIASMVNVVPESLPFNLARWISQETDINKALYFRYLDKLLTNKVNDILEVMFVGTGTKIGSYSKDLNDLTNVIVQNLGAEESSKMLAIINDMVGRTIIDIYPQRAEGAVDAVPLFDLHTTMYCDKYSISLGLDKLGFDHFRKVDIRSTDNALVTLLCRMHEKHPEFSGHELYIHTKDNNVFKIIRIDHDNVAIKRFYRNV